MLTKRDRQIIAFLNKFRVADRDSIAEIFFAGLKRPTYSANNVLLRLMRDGQIQRSTAFVPYLYFGPDVQLKKNGSKVAHFLAILETYKDIHKQGPIESFLVEPRYGPKGKVEPDCYLNFRKTGFFIEVQRSLYSEKTMREKMERYVSLYHSGIMAKPFPHVLILSDHRYALEGDWPFRIFQAESFGAFMRSLQPQQEERPAVAAGGIRARIK